MENLDIKYAIEFINKMGYSWNGKILNRENPTTIYNFYSPQKVELNGEIKGLILYNEQDNSPECIIYNIIDNIFVSEKDLTKEWIDFLKG